MSILDGIMKQVAGSPDTVASLAEQVGIDPAMVEKAVAALGQSHPEDGDTLELASAKTGLDIGALGTIMQQLGGEGALGDIASQLQGGEGGGLAGSLRCLTRMATAIRLMTLRAWRLAYSARSKRLAGETEQ